MNKGCSRGTSPLLSPYFWASWGSTSTQRGMPALAPRCCTRVYVEGRERELGDAKKPQPKPQKPHLMGKLHHVLPIESRSCNFNNKWWHYIPQDNYWINGITGGNGFGFLVTQLHVSTCLWRPHVFSNRLCSNNYQLLINDVLCALQGYEVTGGAAQSHVNFAVHPLHRGTSH